MLLLLVAFVLGNSVAAISTNSTMLLVARIITALSHGVFMPIGATLAASLVPENKRASAIAIMFTELTVATITGVPIGTFLGQLYDWRFAFVGIAVIGVIGLIVNSILIPSKWGTANKTRKTYVKEINPAKSALFRTLRNAAQSQ